jgi:hypothetical protein
MTGVRTSAGEELERRLDAVGWGVLLLYSGVLRLVSAPWGAWLAGVGLILLGASAARRALRLKVSGFIVICGSVALGTGLGQLAGLDVPGLALLLIACGLALIAGTVVRRGEAANRRA